MLTKILLYVGFLLLLIALFLEVGPDTLNRKAARSSRISPHLVSVTRDDYQKYKGTYDRFVKKAGAKIGNGVDDAWLWIEAVNKLGSDDDLEKSDIRVAVQDGVVRLTGTVFSPTDKKRAGEMLKDLDANGVDNVLTIKRRGTTSSTSLHQHSIGDTLQDLLLLELPAETEIKAECPTTMVFDESNPITISVRPGLNPSTPALDREEETHTSILPLPEGTPGVALKDEYGDGYDVQASATLTGTAFDLQPVITESQPVDSSEVVWQWNALPKYSGKQFMNAAIFMEWKPKKKGGQTIKRQIGSVQFVTTVKNPWIKVGQIDLITLITGGSFVSFLGAGLTKLWDHFKGKKEPDYDPTEIGKD